ncbi:hypothetical protein POSPLADRAFT_1060811 [Postia placenta MAD-698-R-SB12]|uniref:NADH:ubiquinone reductase (non-electrogenic) n=1 Tax=Postia placenta MAD-698-R-SB12 TaxID=670580 RepID=A0A1X6MQ38_9APHY|nr:hypothetical protein POSPLADRAFT_1060811 [Postia placenta MAD-698-R-SB12]OSX58316.1 hypothetical protein POSPLADRAFT_1060811 [Postia placenta MAD-698-R-SB12]
MTFQEVDTIIVMASTSATSAGTALYCSSHMSSRKLVSPAAYVYRDMSLVNNTLPSIVNCTSDSGLPRYLEYVQTAITHMRSEPPVTVGTLNPRSIIQPARYVTRHKARQVSVIGAFTTEVDTGDPGSGCEDDGQVRLPLLWSWCGIQGFNIPGVKENACFMKELEDAEKMQRRFFACLEPAAFPGQTSEEATRLLHMAQAASH